jgi:hypothetical protein
MAYSIYHFFADLCQRSNELTDASPLDSFPFDERMLSCVNKGKFPDLAIRLNHDDGPFSGGELIELKDSSKSYSVASFNSTIPMGVKDIRKLISGSENVIRTQMQEAGNNILSVPIRQVFYLVRGKKSPDIKICLSHGKFFETVPVSTLISEAFGQALEERLAELKLELSEPMKKALLDIFSEQETFSRTRSIDNASVQIRFRIMTQVEKRANLLNSKQYPQIGDNTLNFAVPCHDEGEKELHIQRMQTAFCQMNLSHLYSQMDVFLLQHHFNGNFLIFQTNLLST